MAYSRVNWQNSVATPVNAGNLNIMDAALLDHDNKIGSLTGQGITEPSLAEATKNIKNRANEVTYLASYAGIVADGVTEQSAAINSFLNTVDTMMPSVTKIKFPDGTIIIDTTITFKNTNPNRRLIFECYNTTFKLTNQSTAFHSHLAMLIVKDNIIFRGANVDGNFDNNYYTIDSVNYHYTLTGMNPAPSEPDRGSIGIAIQGHKVVVEDCILKDISWSGIDTANPSSTDYYKHIVIRNNKFYATAQDSIALHRIDTADVYNNWIYSTNHHAIHDYSYSFNDKIHNNHIIFSDEYFRDFGYIDGSICGIKIGHDNYPDNDVSGAEVYENEIKDIGTHPIFTGMEFSGYAKEFSVHDNFIQVKGGAFGVLVSSPLRQKVYFKRNRVISENIAFYRKTLVLTTITFTDTDGVVTIDDNYFESPVNCVAFNESIVCSTLGQVYNFGSKNIYKNLSNCNAFNFFDLSDLYTVNIDKGLIYDTSHYVSTVTAGLTDTPKIYMNGAIYNEILNGDYQLNVNGIPHLFSTRNNGTTTSLTAPDATSLLLSTSGVPTSHSSIQYSSNKKILSDELITVSFTYKSLEAHNLDLQLQMDGETTKDFGAFACPGDNVERKYQKTYYVPKLNTITGNLNLMLFVDLGGPYTQITGLTIKNLQITRGYSNQVLQIKNNVQEICDASTVKPRIFYTVLAAPPSSGNFNDGDEVRRVPMVVGSPKGWTRVSGVWQTLGNL